MHLVVGFIRITLATALGALFKVVRADWIGRLVIRLCCSAFLAGAGLDDAAINIVRDLGPDGQRLLEAESHAQDGQGTASLMLAMIRAAQGD